MLDSMGMGNRNIDQKYMKEARNIQDYLTQYQDLAPRSLGHDSRQHNNIQLDTPPELLREHPDAWNMLDSNSYTPYAQEAGSLFSHRQADDGQILQSQNSMGRVFVPLNPDTQRVRNSVSKNYGMPQPRLANGMVDPERAVAGYPNIMKSFYPNVPFQTVSGASLHPPTLPAYRSFIQQGYQNPAFPQSMMQAPMPVMMPFSGFVGNSNPQVQYAMSNPPRMFGQNFVLPVQSAMAGGGSDAGQFYETAKKSKAKEPGMLTVSSSDDVDDARVKPKNSDFEGM